MQQLSRPIKTIFIDADDTLWENEQFFRDAEALFAQLLAPHADPAAIQRMLWEKQEENIPLYGYGSKEELDSHGAIATAKDCEELFELLKK